MIKKYFALSLVTASMFVMGCSSSDDDDDDTPETPEMPAPPVDPAATPGVGGTAFDTIATRPDLSTLLAAINAVPGLADTLDNPENAFTIFAPNNNAFDALEASNPDDDAIDALLNDPDTLGPILTFHVLSGTVDSTTASAAVGTPQTTANGATVELASSATAPTGLSINGADILEADVAPADGGIGFVHVIAGVLIPPAPEPGGTDGGTDDGGTDGGTDGGATDGGGAPGGGTTGPVVTALQGAGLGAFVAFLDTNIGSPSLEDNTWTVFAPTDAALAAATGTVSEQDHIFVGGNLDPDALSALSELVTNGGNSFAIGGDATALTIGGFDATLVNTGDAGATVYQIDGVLQ